MTTIDDGLQDNEALELREDTEVHLSTSFSRIKNKNRNKEKIKRKYHLIVKGLLISSIVVGSILGTATSAFAAEKPSSIEIPNAYAQSYTVPKSGVEQQSSSAYILNLRMANKLLGAAIQKGELTPSLFDSLNQKMNALMDRLDTIDNMRETAIVEVDVTDDLLEIGHYQDASEFVMAKREESIKILEELQNKLGIEPSGHVLSAPVSTKSGSEVRVLSTSSVTQQHRTAQVTIDGKLQSFSQPAVVIDGSTVVPMRGVFEALGATIKWDQATQTVTATKDSTTIKLTIGNKYAHVNNEKVALAKEALILNGSTMVPLRFVAEALGSKVEWDAPTYTAIITSAKGSGGTGVTNPGTGVTNPTNPTNPTTPGNGTGVTAPTTGINAVETNGRTYGSRSQAEYDTVLKLAKEALAEIDNVIIPKAMTDYLYNGARSNGQMNTYQMELYGYHNQLSPLLEAGVSPDTIVKDFKLSAVFGKLIRTNTLETSTSTPGVDSAYHAIVEGKLDCDSLAQTVALVYDLAGFDTAIIGETNHAFAVHKLDDQWIRGQTPIGSDINAFKESIKGSMWLVAPN